MARFRPRRKTSGPGPGPATPGPVHTPSSLKTVTPSAGQTPLRVTPLPARTRTPVPPNRKPRIGFLNWGGVKDIERSYCADLFNHFAGLQARGTIDFIVLEPASHLQPFPPLERVVAARLDAAVCNGIWNHDFLSDVAKLKFPMVSCDHDASGQPFDSVFFDGIAGGERISKELLARGHTDVLFISRQRYDNAAVAGADPIIEDPTYQERRFGVQQGLLGSTADFWPVISWVPRLKDGDVIKKIMDALKLIVADMGHWPTAIVTPDLGVTISIKQALEAMGFQIPGHLSLVTFHSMDRKEILFGIARVEYSFAEMGRHAWELLSSRLAGDKGPPRKVKVPPCFIADASIGPRRAGP